MAKAHRHVDRFRSCWLDVQLQNCNRSVPAAIDCAFGADAPAARRVAWCESTWNPGARNGQYLGLFQLSDALRAQYAHGAYTTAYEQALAGARAFHAAHGWGPWECRP